MNKKLAVFCFEASAHIGAGHAVRCSVLINSLISFGWKCIIVTSKTTYEFVKLLNTFERIDPDIFHANPFQHDLLVIDNYKLDFNYQNYFRAYAKKILVIDDLANRKHNCDILLDQTYNRDPKDYKNLVPAHCKILAGSDYALLRKEFILMRPKAIEKRRNSKGIRRILISMGGSDPNNYTLKALELVKKSGFEGNIDVVLGFVEKNLQQIKKYVKSMINKVEFHVNVNNMAELIYEADLAIGAAGSSVWERCCLGLPSVLVVTAKNQVAIYMHLIESGICYPPEDLNLIIKNINGVTFKKNSFNDFNIYNHENCAKIVDGFGVNRILFEIKDNDLQKNISFRKATELDKDMVFGWQKIKGIRQYFNNTTAPSYDEHSTWFYKKLAEYENPYWIICENTKEIGAVILTYNFLYNHYDLSWYLVPDKQFKGLGTIALRAILNIIRPLKVHAFVKEENIASHKSLQKLGFLTPDNQNYFFEYEDTIN